MSNNKIGFLSALVLYVSVFAGIYLLDFDAILVGQNSESKAFSIRLENIGDFSAGATQKQYHSHSEQSAKARSEESKPRESNPKISVDSADSNANSRDSNKSNAESTANQNESAGGGVSIAQNALGQNDPYFLAITRIINRFHTKASVRNLYGVVGVEFSVNTNGEIEDLRVIKSSGSVKLDNIALQTIRRASRNFPTPKKNYYIKTALVYKRS